MTQVERIALWAAINGYVTACGGDTSAATVSVRRQRAVVAVERKVEAIAAHVAQRMSNSRRSRPARKRQ